MSKEGYYDDNGNYIGGFYDEDGNYVEGYYDEYGSYALAYYDEKGNYLGGGYYNERGEYVEYAYEIEESAQSAEPVKSAAPVKEIIDDSEGEYNIDDDDDLTYENLDAFAFSGSSGYSSSKSGSGKNKTSKELDNSMINRRSSASRSGRVDASSSSRSEKSGSTGKRRKKKLTVGKVILRAVIALLVFVLITVGGLYFTILTIVKGPSEAAKNLFVSTIQETGQMKFVNKLFFSEDEIVAITGQNSMGTLDEELDTGLITIGGGSSEDGSDVGDSSFDINGFELIELTGRTYYAKMMIINDPSRVKLSTIYNGSWPEYGQCLDEFVENGNYLAGVNGGEYQSDSNKGGHPKGIVVCDGEIQYNNPQAGDVLIGFNTDNILIIRDVGNLSAAEAKSLVEELQIRDCVTFKDIADGDDNHFAKLIINGESIPLSGSGSGANPRTVIGQKADGTVLILVTDGRGASGHLGATAADLVSIMQEYGAVNAANMDGGSSSSMYYDGNYEMTSVTLYYANSSWRLPLAFVVERRD